MKPKAILHITLFGKVFIDKIKAYQEILKVCPSEKKNISELSYQIPVSKFSEIINGPAYSVKDIYDFIKIYNFNFVTFSKFNRYQYYKKQLASSLKKLEAFYINELYGAHIAKHICLITNFKPEKALLSNLENIPILNNITYNEINDICQHFFALKKKKKGKDEDTYTIKLKFEVGINRRNFITYNLNSYSTNILLSIDNKRTFKEIFQKIRSQFKKDITDEYLLKIINPIFKKMEIYDFILLKKKNKSNNLIEITN